jgi:Ca-activated chloride channel family protein
LHIPIHTVALGRLDTTIPNPNPFGPPISVPPDPETLARIARASGGRAFTAEDADQLNNIYKTLGSQLGVKQQPKEISASFALGALILLLGAGATSLRWAGRLP